MNWETADVRIIPHPARLPMLGSNSEQLLLCSIILGAWTVPSEAVSKKTLIHSAFPAVQGCAVMFNVLGR
jgi:hypothetical protein